MIYFAYKCMSTLYNLWHVLQPFFLMDEDLLSIIVAGCSQLEKMLITLEPHIYLDQTLLIYLF